MTSRIGERAEMLSSPGSIAVKVMNSNRLKNFLAKPLRPIADKVSLYIDKPTRVTKGGLNFHKSNRAKEGNIMDF